MIQYYFSPSQSGFYTSDTGCPIPEDAVEITHGEWEGLLEQHYGGEELYFDAEEGKPKTRVPAITMDHIRSRRDGLLSKSDWTQLPDVPEVIRSTWATYRQQLRDLPETYNDVAADVVWPTPPEL